MLTKEDITQIIIALDNQAVKCEADIYRLADKLNCTPRDINTIMGLLIFTNTPCEFCEHTRNKIQAPKYPTTNPCDTCIRQVRTKDNYKPSNISKNLLQTIIQEAKQNLPSIRKNEITTDDTETDSKLKFAKRIDRILTEI